MTCVQSACADGSRNPIALSQRQLPRNGCRNLLLYSTCTVPNKISTSQVSSIPWRQSNLHRKHFIREPLVTYIQNSPRSTRAIDWRHRCSSMGLRPHDRDRRRDRGSPSCRDELPGNKAQPRPLPHYDHLSTFRDIALTRRPETSLRLRL
jgi:hypothetical protein